MTYKICYWDEVTKTQQERDSNPEEDAQREIDIAAHNARVPQQVTALQGLLAIDQAGLSSAYESWANDPARTFAERAFINKALNWRRNDPVLLAGAQVLGLTSENLDTLFINAAKL